MNDEEKDMGSNERLILAVSLDLVSGEYKIASCKGSSVHEMAFVMMATIKTLVKTGNVKDSDEFLDILTNYCKDSQYDEINEVDEVNDVEVVSE